MQGAHLGSSLDGTLHVVQEADQIVTVSLEGDFDLTNAPAVGEQIDRALDGNNHVIIDLSQAMFIDSSIIRALIRASKTADLRGRTAVLALGTAAIVERAIEVAGISRVLPRAHTRAEAVQIIQECSKHSVDPA